jgi:hypothetical protein
MTTMRALSCFFLGLIFVFSSYFRAGAEPGLPGGTVATDVPTLLAPGLVNSGLNTRDATMTPDGREMYFCMAGPGYGQAVILVTKFENGVWTEPEVAPFSGSSAWIDLEPFVSPDGKRFFFMSTRPEPGEEEGEADIWVMDREGDRWSEPRNLGAPVNSGLAEYFPAVTLAGDLYFTRADSTGRVHHIFRSQWENGVYGEPELLPEQVNCGTNRFNATVTPDESRLIVPAAGVPGSYGSVDYFLVRRNAADTWEEPVNLGPVINDGAGQSWSPYLTPDGQTFMFMSTRRSVAEPAWPPTWGQLQAAHRSAGGGNPNIYVVKADFLDRLPDHIPGSGSAAELATLTPVPFPELTGPYLGQTPPGKEPRIFAAGVVSTGMNERDLTISADGKTLWYGFMGQGLVTVMESRLEEGRWSEPAPVAFHRDGKFVCFEPTLDAAGTRVLFLSNQAAPGQEQGTGWANQNIFSSRLVDGVWGDPVALPAPVTTAAAEYFPSLAADGSLYFTREDENGSAIWTAEPEGDGFGVPVKLSETVNVGPNNYNATVAPDESWIIVCVAGHDDNLGRSDFWISFRSESGSWRQGVNLGEKFNAPGARASSASLSPNREILFFSTNKTKREKKRQKDKNNRSDLLTSHGGPGNGSNDIWWVDVSAVLEVR